MRAGGLEWSSEDATRCVFMKRRPNRVRQSGFLLMEVLITMVILLIGLLGLAGLQARAMQSENESYQRVQALILLRDIADRINANRAQAANYIALTTAPLGTGSTKDCSAPTTVADIDLCAWDAALKGAAETSGGNSVGAMIGARGCVTSTAADQYLLEVVWQGLVRTATPPNTVLCGLDLYGDETQRRAVTSIVQIGDLVAP